MQAGAPLTVNGIRYKTFGEAWSAVPVLKVGVSAMLAVPVAVGYLILLNLNKTRIVIDGVHVSINKGPIPWFSPKSRRLQISEVKGLQKRASTINGARAFDLSMNLSDGTRVDLAKACFDESEIDELEALVRRHLNSVS